MAIISARYAKYISLSVSDKPPDFDTFDAWVTLSDKPSEFNTFDAYVERFGMQHQQISTIFRRDIFSTRTACLLCGKHKDIEIKN
jgi:hypothetical protein